MAADGQIDLKLFSMIDPRLSASGLATIHMTLGGTLDEPLPQGSVVIRMEQPTTRAYPAA